MNGDAAEERLASLLAARDEALAAGQAAAEAAAEVPPELQPRLDRALAALQLLHEARPRGQPTVPTGEPSTGPHPEAPSTGPDLPVAASTPPDQIGRFRILRELGRGGFGIVFLAHDPRLGREVALKVPRLDALLTADLRARFQQEARAAAGLDHPNIVAVHEAGEAGPVCYIASAYCPGPTLAAWLRAQTAPVPPADAAGLVATLAEAVHHAHCRRVLHRDLKPANVLLTFSRGSEDRTDDPARFCEPRLNEGVPRITDFGLAKLTELAADSAAPEVRTRSGAVLGTAAYMAPEQARGKPRNLDTRTDIYSLGAILYELLTGRPPFVGDTDLDILLQAQNEEPLPPSRLRRKLPRDLEWICLKCLEKEPYRRYETAGSLAEDLWRFLTGKAIFCRPVSAAERMVRWAKRRPAVAALTAAVGLITILGLGGILWQWSRAEIRRGEAETARGEAEGALRAEEQAHQREQAQRQRAERNLYFRLITLAHQAEQAHNVAEAERCLSECPPALRQWEWYYLKRQCRPQVLVLDARAGPVLGMHFDPDGQRLWAQTIASLRCWDATSDKQLGQREGPRGTSVAHHVAFSPDGKRIAVGFRGRVTDSRSVAGIKVFQADTLEQLCSLPGLGPMVFSPDGQRLAGPGVEPTVKVWDVSGAGAGRELQSWSVQSGATACLAFSADGRLLACGNLDRGLSVWDTVAGRLRFQCRGHTGGVRGLAFRPDGRHLASASEDRTVRIWDTTSGEEVRTLCGHTQPVLSVQYNSTGELLASAGVDRTVRFWDASWWGAAGARPQRLPPAGAQELGTCRGHTDDIPFLAFSPDGKRLASGSRDGTARIWPAPGLSGQTLRNASVVFRPDGKCLAAVRDAGKVEIQDTESGQALHSIDGLVYNAILAPTGTHLFLSRPPQAGSGAPARQNFDLVVWDTRSGRVVWTLPPQTSFLGFSPDGRHFATRGPGLNGPVVLREVTNGDEVHTFRDQSDPSTRVVFSPDGRYVALVGLREKLTLWDSTTGRELPGSVQAPQGATLVVAFSADGRRLATGGTDRVLRLWETATGKLLHAFPAQTNFPTSVAFHPDGKRLVSGDRDRIIKLWDLDGLQEVLSFSSDSPPAQLVFSPDGGRLLATNGSVLAQLWNGTPTAGE